MKDYQKIPRLIHKFSKITWLKINVEKSIVLLYTNNEAAEKVIKKSIPFVSTSNIIYLRIKLTKRINDLYSGKYKILMKEIEYDTKNGKKKVHAHGLEKQILSKCLYYTKQSRHLMHSLSK